MTTDKSHNISHVSRLIPAQGGEDQKQKHIPISWFHLSQTVKKAELHSTQVNSLMFM